MESVRKHSKMLDWQVKQIKEPFKDFAISGFLFLLKLDFFPPPPQKKKEKF